jgi:DNA-binding transcriptional ArsR family regulator
VPDIYARAVLLYLVEAADKYGASFRGIDKIAAACKCSERSVMRALDRLEDAGLIHRRSRYRRDGTRTTDVIKLLADSQSPSSSETKAVAPTDSQSGLGDSQSELGDRESPLIPLVEPLTRSQIRDASPVGDVSTTRCDKRAYVEDEFLSFEDAERVLDRALGWAEGWGARDPWAYLAGAINRAGAEEWNLAALAEFNGWLSDDEGDDEAEVTG